MKERENVVFDLNNGMDVYRTTAFMSAMLTATTICSVAAIENPILKASVAGITGIFALVAGKGAFHSKAAYKEATYLCKELPHEFRALQRMRENFNDQ